MAEEGGELGTGALARAGFAPHLSHLAHQPWLLTPQGANWGLWPFSRTSGRPRR